MKKKAKAKAKAPAKKAPKKAAPKKAVKKTAKKPAPKKAAKPMKAAAKPVKEVKKSGPMKPTKPVLSQPKNKSSLQFTQSEFFEAIRGYCGFNTRSEARKFYEDFASMIQTSLKSGWKLSLPGLGRMQVRKTKARMGRNPATQEPIQIPARRKVAFTPTKVLKEAVL